MKTTKDTKEKKFDEKEAYSLRALIPEITGVDEKSYFFDSAYKEIQRLVLLFREQLGIKESKLQITLENKDQYIHILKTIYNSQEYRDTLKRVSKLEKEDKEKGNEEKENKKKVDYSKAIDDIDVLINVFVEALTVNAEEVEKQEIESFINEMKCDEFYEKGDEIKEQVLKDILEVGKIDIFKIKLNLLEQYKDILDNALVEWRNRVSKILFNQDEMNRITKEVITNIKNDKENKRKL